MMTTCKHCILISYWVCHVGIVVEVPIQVKVSQQCVFTTSQQLIKYMKVSLPLTLVHHPRLFQQVVENVTSYWITLAQTNHYTILCSIHNVYNKWLNTVLDYIKSISFDYTHHEIECYVHVFPKATGIVIAVSLGIAEGLQHRIALQ